MEPLPYPTEQTILLTLPIQLKIEDASLKFILHSNMAPTSI
ncbi:hypothetical protein [Vibrio gallaecicus]|nr:hypothetical protein [Vibrio gallaecicus]MDN3613019.1 hypothetical protein [Vibrio gallaecicus]